MDMIGNEEQMKLLNSFAMDLQSTMGAESQKISFEELWRTNPPSEAHGQSLAEYMKDASRDSFFYEDYHNFNGFREDYRQKFQKNAYISPPVRWQWYVRTTCCAQVAWFNSWQGIIISYLTRSSRSSLNPARGV
jgi:hypothetical protein